MIRNPPSIGQKYGSWVVLSIPSDAGRKIFCKCKCGTKSLVAFPNLKSGVSTKCQNCRAKSFRKFTHPDGSTPDIRRKAYNAMVRCNVHKHYAGRGICLYGPWQKDIGGFVAYLMTLPGWDNPSLRLDRINNDGNYEPKNLRFVTISESMKNRRKWGTSKKTLRKWERLRENSIRSEAPVRRQR